MFLLHKLKNDRPLGHKPRPNTLHCFGSKHSLLIIEEKNMRDGQSLVYLDVCCYFHEPWWKIHILEQRVLPALHWSRLPNILMYPQFCCKMYLSAFLAIQVSAVRTPDMELSKTPSVVTFQELSGMASFFWEMNEKGQCLEMLMTCLGRSYWRQMLLKVERGVLLHSSTGGNNQ